jgi:predicted nucleic acid-binding protein
MITLDTSALLAIADASDPDHERVSSELLADRGPWIVPAGILGEVGYMLQSISSRALDAFLADMETGAYTLDCGEEDWSRIRELASRYANLPLGLADASVVACAERHTGRVLSLDERDLQIVAREGRITVLPGE